MNSTIKPRYGRSPTRNKGWRVFFSPGWVFFTLAIIVFSYFAFTFLAPWQLSRDGAIVQRNEQIDTAFEVDPVPVREVFDTEGAIEAQEEWTRVILTGRYLAEDEVLLRLRPVDSSPAFHALTPFQLTSGEVILVNRGYEPPFEGGVPPIEAPPTGEQSILGHARPNEQVSVSAPLQDQGVRQVYGINTGQIEQVTGTALAKDYVQLAEGEAGEINAIPVPMLERGSHLSYAFQWIAFGIMAPLGLGYFIWAELKERRRVRREEIELAEFDATSDTFDDPTDGRSDDTAAEPGDAASTSHPENDTDRAVNTPDLSSTASDARSRMLHDRYGNSQPNHYGKLSARDRERF